MYGLLTRIAEMIGGKQWEVLVKEHIFDPLDMTSSNFATTADPENLELATGYNDDYGELKKVPWQLSKYVWSTCNIVDRCINRWNNIWYKLLSLNDYM